MDFELSDEQRLFRQTPREFADKEIVPVASELERAGRYRRGSRTASPD